MAKKLLAIALFGLVAAHAAEEAQAPVEAQPVVATEEAQPAQAEAQPQAEAKN
jgi:hypothetical protein